MLDTEQKMGMTHSVDPDTGLPVLPEDPSIWTPCTWMSSQTVVSSSFRYPRGCGRRAGEGTDHPGVGRCARHDGIAGRKESAWLMAHLIARTLDISPWEALLLAVRRAATWAFFYETKMGEVAEGDDDAMRPGGRAYDWVIAAERANRDMARYAKMAVDAGVAAMLVQQAQTEGATIARIVNTALGAVDLTPQQETAIRAALREALLSMETPSGVLPSSHSSS